MTENEERLGYVGSVSFDAETGDVVSLQVDKGDFGRVSAR